MNKNIDASKLVVKSTGAIRVGFALGVTIVSILVAIS